jgi:hypothetical protein
MAAITMAFMASPRRDRRHVAVVMLASAAFRDGEAPSGSTANHVRVV